MVRGKAVVVAAALAAGSALAQSPVKRIDIYVTPYYEAARDAGGTPTVAVNKSFDALLASNRREDVAKARDLVSERNATVTPMTLMVLAIRLYDVGLRDDAVFWFYAAKDRYGTLAEVADMRSPALAQVEDATRNFATLAGPVINGYAFCDVAKQQKIAARALQWTIDNPYEALMLPQLPARPGDRAAKRDRAIAQLKAAVAKERAYLNDPANLAKFKAQRRENGADAKYCWNG